MNIYQLTEKSQAEKAYPCTTESSAHFWAVGLPLSRSWFAENLGNYIEGFHIEDDDGIVIGHIYWAPTESALVPYWVEDHVAFIYCDWIQHHHRGKGYMKALFEAFLDHLANNDFKGILVDGTDIEEYMHASHFAKRGFQVMRETNGGKLMYYPLAKDKVLVEHLSSQVKREEKTPVEVLVIGSLACPVGSAALLYIRKLAHELGNQVNLVEVKADNEAKKCYGMADGIFINGKIKFFGPVSEDEVREAIIEEIRS